MYQCKNPREVFSRKSAKLNIWILLGHEVSVNQFHFAPVGKIPRDLFHRRSVNWPCTVETSALTFMIFRQTQFGEKYKSEYELVGPSGGRGSSRLSGTAQLGHLDKTKLTLGHLDKNDQTLSKNNPFQGSCVFQKSSFL